MGYCRNASSRARKTCSRPTLTASVGSSVWTCSQPYLRFGWVTFQNHVHSFKSSASSNPWFRGLSGMFIQMFSGSSLIEPNGPPLKLFQREGGVGILRQIAGQKPSPNPLNKPAMENPVCKIIYSTNLHPLCKTWTWLIFRMDGDTRCWNTQVAPHFLPKKRHRFFSPLTSPKGPWIATFHCAWHFGLWRLWFRIGGPQSGYGV